MLFECCEFRIIDEHNEFILDEKYLLYFSYKPQLSALQSRFWIFSIGELTFQLSTIKFFILIIVVVKNIEIIGNEHMKVRLPKLELHSRYMHV